MTTTKPAAAAAARKGHCSVCHKVWTIPAAQGQCPWCHKPAMRRHTARPRPIKTGRHKARPASPEGGGYDRLESPWLKYYTVAARFNRKAKPEDTQDVLHDIICTLADAERANGVALTDAQAYRIASYRHADYWRTFYKLTNGLDCGHCTKTQKAKCKGQDLYRNCPKLIRLESLNESIMDSEGNLTERGDLIVDDKALDLDAWIDARTFLLGAPARLLKIAVKKMKGESLTKAEHSYMERWRRREKQKLL